MHGPWQAHLMSAGRLTPRIMSRVPRLTSNSPTSSAAPSPAPISRMTGSREGTPLWRSASSYAAASSERAVNWHGGRRGYQGFTAGQQESVIIKRHAATHRRAHLHATSNRHLEEHALIANRE